jgi:RNA polymerase sigma-70 factor (sigma-E family)
VHGNVQSSPVSDEGDERGADRGRAEDAVQSAFTKLYLRWSRLDDIATVESYVRRIIVTSLIDEGRRGWFRRESVSAGLPEVAMADDLADVSAGRLAVLAALAQVPPRQRAVLVLRFWEDQSVEQVAILLGCAPGTVKSQTARGLQRLRELLGSTMTTRSEEPV